VKNYHTFDLKEIGTRIRDARKKHCLTQESAAEKAFITGQFWSLIESGRERASVNTYMQIAAVLNLTLDDIFYDNATILRLNKAFSQDSLLSSCTVTEKAIISETIMALRNAFIRNRDVNSKKFNIEGKNTFQNS
jgi:DNA-binding XRE family transcriptional regulator